MLLQYSIVTAVLYNTTVLLLKYNTAVSITKVLYNSTVTVTAVLYNSVSFRDTQFASL